VFRLFRLFYEADTSLNYYNVELWDDQGVNLKDIERIGDRMQRMPWHLLGVADTTAEIRQPG
jgi:hypothetical protein